MSVQSTEMPVDRAWVQIFPRIEFGRKAVRQFLWFVALSSLAVFVVGSIKQAGIFFVLIYLCVVPGGFGVGWGLLYLFWVGKGVARDHERLLSEARAAFGQHARSSGEIQYLDVSLDTGVFTGLALAGRSLLVVQDGQLRKLFREEIRGWRWEIHSPVQLIGNGDGFTALDARLKDDRARERVNGFFVQTFDPDRPEVWLRTSREDVCRRWELILENIVDGRTAID